MAKNLGREFATMSDDERRKFALKQTDDMGEAPELDFDDPRDADRMGKQYGSLKEEIADPDNRDGTSALLDDEAHQRNVERQRRSRGGREASRDIDGSGR